jgi:hypothetical protein
MMLSSNVCRFVLFYFLSLSVNADTNTVRGVQRELAGEKPVNLRSAGDYVILAKTGISTVPTSAITGDIAVSPIDATAITGFSLVLSADGTSASSTQFTGKATAASYGGAVATALTTAVSDMETAYTDAAGRVNPDAARINLGAGILGGVFGGATAPLTPGVYTFSTNVAIKDEIVFSGSDTDVFIIQVAGTLEQDPGIKVTLNGAKAENIFWQVAEHVIVGAGAHMEGILLVKTKVDFITGSSLNGRVLTQTACNLQSATIKS